MCKAKMWRAYRIKRCIPQLAEYGTARDERLRRSAGILHMVTFPAPTLEDALHQTTRLLPKDCCVCGNVSNKHVHVHNCKFICDSCYVRREKGLFTPAEYNA